MSSYYANKFLNVKKLASQSDNHLVIAKIWDVLIGNKVTGLVSNVEKKSVLQCGGNLFSKILQNL